MHPALALSLVLLALLLLWWVTWLIYRGIRSAALRLLESLPRHRVWQRAHPLREWFRERWPRLSGFLYDRFRADRFSGLPLTLLVGAALYSAALLGGVVEEVMEDTAEVNALDERLSDSLEPLRTPAALLAFRWITEWGAVPALTALSLVSTGFLWSQRRGHRIAGLWVTIVGSHLTAYLGKAAFDRPRPTFATDVVVYTASFPSAHATASMAVYGFLAYTIARDLPKMRQRFGVGYWAAVLILLVGFSRIFLNVHHTSDVAAGYLVGFFWLLAGIVTAEQLRTRAIGRQPPVVAGL